MSSNDLHLSHHPYNVPSTSNSSTPQRPRITIPVHVFAEEDQSPPHQQPPTQDYHSLNGASPQTASKKPPGFFVYPERIIKEGVSACKKSILGKIITNKPIHISSIQMGLESIWGSPSGLKIQKAEGKILQIFMDEPMDQERILLGNPWIFRNSWLIV
jgi:hypothetical protein